MKKFHLLLYVVVVGLVFGCNSSRQNQSVEPLPPSNSPGATNTFETFLNQKIFKPNGNFYTTDNPAHTGGFHLLWCPRYSTQINHILEKAFNQGRKVKVDTTGSFPYPGDPGKKYTKVISAQILW